MGAGSQPVWDGEKWVQPGADPQPVTEATPESPAPASPPTPPAEDASGADRLRATISRRPLASGAVCLAIGMVLAAAITAAITVPQISSATDERDNISAELANTEASLDQAHSARDHAQQVAARIRGQRDQIIGDARARASKLTDAAREKLGGINDQIQEAQAKLTSTQSELDDVTASLQQAQATKQMSTFKDGTWSVGDDVLAGTYRSTAGGNCYWEVLKSPSSGALNNIVDNGFGPNATITVSTGQWLHVEDCGTWSPGP